MHRDILGREALFDDALDFGLADRRQSRVVAVHKRKPDVFITHPERRARSLRILLNKAEDAVIAALSRRHGLEIDSPRFALILDDLEPPFLPVRLNDFEDEIVFARDRKSTRLNSSHLGISYAVFCLKKKNIN